MLKIKDNGHFLEVSLDRQEVRNSLSLDLMIQITEVMKEVARNQKIHFVVLEGEGSIFCSGADLVEMKNSSQLTQSENLKQAEILYELFQSLWVLPQPLVTRVQGAAMGGGLGLVALSDYVIADPQARFAFSETKLGLAPAVIGDFILRKWLPSQMAPFMLFATVFSSQEAQSIGLVHKISESGESKTILKEFVQSLSGLGPQALRETKMLLRKMNTLKEDVERKKYVTQLIARLRVSPEGQEGLNSFFEKRKPQWVKYSKDQI